jgi:hypothetical protein
MKTVALVYTLGGRLVPAVMALREAGERIQVRSIQHFGVAESGVHAVFLEVEDSRIRESYESQGVPVSVLESGAEEVEDAPVEIVNVVEIAPQTKPQEPANVTGSRRRKRQA